MTSQPSNATSSPTTSLAGRVALVTGSTTGLGKEMAKSLAAAGAKVAVNYANNQQRAEEMFAEFQAHGYQGQLFRGSAIDETEVTRMTQEIAEELGPIDILVLNATPDQPEKPLEEYDWDFYQSMLDFFIKSPYLFTRAILPHLKEQHWGRIINIGSEVFQEGRPNFSAYVAAKGGQNGWTRSMSTELVPFGITVNMVAPGWIPVERHEEVPQEIKDDYFNKIPAGRWGERHDVAGIVTFLASEAASFISGQSIGVNGGRFVS